MMKAEARVFLGITAFFVLIGVIYWFTSYEDAGAVMLAASAGMGVIAGGAILLLSRGEPARPEDDPRATLAEGAGTVDAFPTHSIWPFAVGLSAAVAASGFAFGAWLVLVGTGALAVSLISWILQARREHLPGEPSHHGEGESSSASST